MEARRTAWSQASGRAWAGISAVLSLTLLAACGGGGGGSGGGESGAPSAGGSQTPSSYRVGGTVSGLAGGDLVISDNGGDAVTVQSDGSFTFTRQLANGTGYAVAIQAQPVSPGQTCVVAPDTASGQVAGADVTSVAVHCSVNMHRLGGIVTGLAGSGLVLQEAGGETFAPTADGRFAFASSHASGSAYRVSVASQPANPSQTCTVGGGSGQGTLADADIVDIAIVCSINAYSINGVVSGLTGSGLVLQENGGDDLAVTSNGGFGFGSHVASGAAYQVSVKHQPTGPSQVCSVSAGTGLVTSGDVASVAVLCSTQSFAVRGNVTGLTGTGLVLQLNSAGDMPVATAGSFAFPTGVVSGARYAVTVRSQPAHPTQTCTVGTGGTGTVGGADVAGVAVLCSTNSYAIGGTVLGLAGTGLVLQDNGGDDLAVTADGSFSFPSKLASGSDFAVTVRSVPGSPRQTCTIANAAGSVLGADVANVQVSCITSSARFAFLTTNASGYTLGPLIGTVTPHAMNDTTGAIGAPGSAASTGKGSGPVVVAPSGTFAYGSNLVSTTDSSHGSVSAYLVDPATGAMSVNGPEAATGLDTVALSVHPSGRFVYALNRTSSNVSVFSVAPLTGRLSLVQTTSPAGWHPLSIALHPSGRFAYVADTGAGTVDTYAIDATTGMLTAGSTVSTGGFPFAVAVHPSGRAVYAVNTSTNTGSSAVWSFAVDPGTGALTPLNAVGTGIAPNTLTVHPSGRFAYVANYGGPALGTGWIAAGSISTFTIDPSTGRFTATAPEITAGREASCFAVDPSGRFAYMSNGGTDVNSSAIVSQYAIDPSTGTLSTAAPDLAAPGCITLW